MEARRGGGAAARAASAGRGDALPFPLMSATGAVDDGSLSARGVYGVKSMIPILPIVVVTDVLQRGMALQDRVPSFDVLLRQSLASGVRFWSPIAVGAAIYHVAEAVSRIPFPGPPVTDSDAVASAVEAPVPRADLPPGPSRASRALGGAVGAVGGGLAAAGIARTLRFYSSGPLQAFVFLSIMGAVAAQLVPTYETAMAHRDS